MRRQALSLWLAFCVAAGLMVTPAATVQLVCRMTGLPMAPIVRTAGAGSRREVAAAAHRMPCCVVDMRSEPGGAVRFALAARSCCDLKVIAAVAHGPALPSPAALHVPAAVTLSPVSIPAPVVDVDAVRMPVVARQSAPRAPPGRVPLLRAPPVLS